MKIISMKHIIGFAVAAMVIAVAACTQPAKQEQQTAELAGLFPKGELIDTSHFSAGQAWVYWIMRPDSIYQTQLASVTYEPGARTRWHSHPAGQIIIITSGTAYIQEKGKPKQILSKGDIAKCLPGGTHWHGAAPDSPMTFTAVSPNMQLGGVQWLEDVTDEEYAN